MTDAHHPDLQELQRALVAELEGEQ